MSRLGPIGEAPVNPRGWREGLRTASIIPVAATETVAPLASLDAGFTDQPIGVYGSARKEYFAGRNPKVGVRPACPVTVEFPDTGWWLSTNSNKRHNRKCENYRKTRGYPCRKDEGVPCKKCGG